MKNGQVKDILKLSIKPLDIIEFTHKDGFNEDIIDFLRARVDSKVNKSVVEP